MKKTIILAILVLTTLSVSGCLPQLSPPKDKDQGKEEPKDEILSLLADLKQETEINFSEVEEVEFKWFIQGEKVLEDTMIAGKGFKAQKSPAEKTPKIETFLESQGFVVDPYNASAATISGATGYLKNDIACLVVSGITGYKEATGQWIPEETDKHDVEVNCGLLENTQEEYCTKIDSVASLSLTEAKEIARASECGDQLKDTYMCNEDTGTWWIDLDIEKSGCNPACVINVVTKEAEINWRCLGLIED